MALTASPLLCNLAHWYYMVVLLTVCGNRSYALRIPEVVQGVFRQVDSLQPVHLGR